MPTRRHLSIFFVGALAIAACATSGTSSEGTGTVGGGGRVDSGGDGTTPNGGSDAGDPGTDAGMMTMSDTGIVITDSSATDTGTVTPGHMECPTTDDAGATTYAYATEYATPPPGATACTMGGAECRAYVECCFIDLCVKYPAP